MRQRFRQGKSKKESRKNKQEENYNFSFLIGIDPSLGFKDKRVIFAESFIEKAQQIN